MTEEVDTKSWLQTLPGILTACAAVLTALGGLIAALSGLFPKFWSQAPAPVVQDCIAGYVWREAYRDDHVCVTLETHMRTIQDNELAGSRRQPGGGAYGPDTCKVGFVWREAFEGDRVCVTVETRTEAAKDNEQSPLRVKR
jgi:hypothetical protein